MIDPWVSGAAFKVKSLSNVHTTPLAGLALFCGGSGSITLPGGIHEQA